MTRQGNGFIAERLHPLHGGKIVPQNVNHDIRIQKDHRLSLLCAFSRKVRAKAEMSLIPRSFHMPTIPEASNCLAVEALDLLFAGSDITIISMICPFLKGRPVN